MALLLGLPPLLLGGFALISAYLPAAELTQSLYRVFHAGVELVSRAGADLPVDAAVTLQEWLVHPLLRFTLAPAGLVLLALGFRRGEGEAEETVDAASPSERAEPKVAALDKRLVKKTRKQAAVLAKKGQLADAGEMLFSAGCLDAAAETFIEGGDFERAAEIRYDQNRFIEAAELCIRGGHLEKAGTIFGQQNEHRRAAECYLQVGNKSVAAEMFEKAGDFRRAAECYREVEFLRHAARAFVQCKDWGAAAACLESTWKEESLKAGSSDPRKQAELKTLMRQAGKLYERAGKLDEALSALERGGWHVEAAVVALRLEQHARAAELFRDAGEIPKAAEVLQELGEHAEAARLMGEYHRDRGELKEAAEALEEAGDFLAAGDLYRHLDDYERAALCYERQHEHGQAAEMWRLVGDRAKAAACYERAGRFTEAAECCALAGMPEREAELLEKAGEFLRAGEVYHREGADDDAIRVLQKVEPEGAGAAHASALLGDIFQARGQLSLAVKKLRQAIEGQDLSRENLGVHYKLATVCEANDQLREAVDLYEKILTFDYHYEDVEERLVRLRDRIQEGPPELQPHESGGSGFVSHSQPGRYQIVGELGRGGMGIVYKARDMALDRLVAFKVLPDSLKENPQALRNFLREAKAAAKLNHPNIVTVYDTGEQDGRYYIAMEYVDGTTLKEILRRRGVISPAGIYHVLLQVCEALSYAHEKKVVHRDIKSANTMWTRDKKAKIMDFGLAKVVEEVRNHTTVVSGTPFYMSPEQTLGKNVDHRTDIYSLGVTVFEMATGTVPFRDGNIPYHHVHTAPPDVREVRPEIPEALARIVTRCLQKDPARRYQSTREIVSEVRASLGQSGAASRG